MFSIAIICRQILENEVVMVMESSSLKRQDFSLAGPNPKAKPRENLRDLTAGHMALCTLRQPVQLEEGHSLSITDSYQLIQI